MKSTIVLEDFDNEDPSIKKLFELLIHIACEKIATTSIITVDNNIVYQSEHKILRVGDTVRHSNEFFVDRGVILPTPEDYFTGFVCVEWEKPYGRRPSGEHGEDLIKVNV